MSPLHIPNTPLTSLTLSPNVGLAFYAGLDGSIRQLTLSRPSFTTPSEKSISEAGVVKPGSPFAACTIGQSLRVYYVNKDGVLGERCQDGGDWYDGALNQLQRKVDDGLHWLYAMNVGDASKPILRVGFTQNGDNGTIDECIWMALKSSESSWHVASYNQ